MAKFIAVAAAAMLAILAGCSDPQPAATAPAAVPPLASSEQPAAAPADPQPSDRSLPPGVTIDAPVEQRSTHGYTTKAGQERRVVIYEFSDGDVASMASTLQTAMAAAGFRARPEKDRDDGKTRMTFTKPGYGRVNAALSADLGNKPKDPEAAGTFSLDIPVGDLISAEVDSR